MAEQEETEDGLEQFMNEIQEDLKINDFDLKEECRTAQNKTQKYIEHYYNYRRKLKMHEAHLKKVEGELFEKYRYNFEINLSSSVDAMRFVQKDKRYLTALKLRDEYETIVDVMEKVVRNFNSRSFAINKMIDQEKIQ
jgi:hypothetical protein